MMNEIHFDEKTTQVLEQLQKGAFLTVKDGEKVNTMTIGWATLGYIWKRPIMTVYVRASRYTYELLKNSQDFTVSVPLQGQLKAALGVAGKVSGRDGDKLAQAEVNLLPSEEVSSPAIAGCDVVYECRIVARQTLDQEHFDEPAFFDEFYADHNLHTVFYGEIVRCRTF